jgi:two-component system chemotaxis response regulator CheY
MGESLMAQKALIVDDSPVTHSLLRKILPKNGYEICGNANNGRDGVELYKKFQPDLVFMDISMPIMNGLEAVKAIKSFKADAKIIMLSAMGDEEIIGQAGQLGVEVFLKKPFDEEKIMNAVSKALLKEN